VAVKNPEIEQAVERLRYLELRPFPLLGCPRRNRWSGRPWRTDVGAAVLALLGQKVTVAWAGGESDVFLTPQGSLLLWRGGPWRSWWQDEAILLAGMVRASGASPVPGVLVIFEVDGKAAMRYLEAPVPAAERSYEETAAAWAVGGEDAPPRWHRRSERAKVICPKCPVRQRCEAIDRVNGATADWV